MLVFATAATFCAGRPAVATAKIWSETYNEHRCPLASRNAGPSVSSSRSSHRSKRLLSSCSLCRRSGVEGLGCEIVLMRSFSGAAIVQSFMMVSKTTTLGKAAPWKVRMRVGPWIDLRPTDHSRVHSAEYNRALASRWLETAWTCSINANGSQGLKLSMAAC